MFKKGELDKLATEFDKLRISQSVASEVEDSEHSDSSNSDEHRELRSGTRLCRIPRPTDTMSHPTNNTDATSEGTGAGLQPSPSVPEGSGTGSQPLLLADRSLSSNSSLSTSSLLLQCT